MKLQGIEEGCHNAYGWSAGFVGATSDDGMQYTQCTGVSWWWKEYSLNERVHASML